MLHGWSFGQCGQVFKNIKMRKNFNDNMSSYVFTTFSREHDNGSLIVNFFSFQPLDVRMRKIRLLCNLTFLT